MEVELMLTNKKMKAWCKFHKRIKGLGINGLSQIEFIDKLNEMLKEAPFEFSFRQKKEIIIPGEKVCVIDIRQNPYVKNGFRPNDLRNMLEANEFEYIQYNHLGNPFYKRHRKENNPKKAKREYQAYVLTNEKARKDFENLFSQFRFKKLFCLICYCNVETPKANEIGKCHRFWLIELLKKKKRVMLN